VAIEQLGLILVYCKHSVCRTTLTNSSGASCTLSVAFINRSITDSDSTVWAAGVTVGPINSYSVSGIK